MHTGLHWAAKGDLGGMGPRHISRARTPTHT